MAQVGRPPGSGEQDARIYLRLPETLRNRMIDAAGEQYAPWLREAIEEKLQRVESANKRTHSAKLRTHKNGQDGESSA